MTLNAEPHVLQGPCTRPTCDWTGFHWHWGNRRFRTTRELTQTDLIDFDNTLINQRKAEKR